MSLAPAPSPLLPILPPQPMTIAESQRLKLASRLEQETSAEVRFDGASRALYASDLSHYRQVPIGVVIPRTLDDVIATVRICREHNVPILGRGAGTSLAGQTCNVAVVLDFSKYLNQVLELNAMERFAWVEPGLINDHLRAAAERHDLTFAPDPATHAYCTLGGMIGNNSCGAHSVLGGKTSENIEELDILLYDGTRMTVGATPEDELERIILAGGRKGELYARLRALRDRHAEAVRARFPDIPRRVSGFNLDYLLPENGFNVARALVGTEGTCALVLQAKTRLIKSPQHRVLLLIAYPDIFAAGDQSPHIHRELKPIAIEGFQRRIVDFARLAGKHMPGLELYPEGDAWLLVEFGADSRDEVLPMARKAQDWVERQDRAQIGLRLLVEPTLQKQAMEVRELGLGVSRVPGLTDETWGGWEDAAVEPAQLGNYLRDLYALCDRYGYFIVLYGHFGQGCVHTQMNFDLRTVAGVAKYRSFVTEAAHLVVRYGGSLSGEHGDGQSRAELLPIMFGDELVGAFREFKSIWDPTGKMNPGKVVDPYPLDSNLRTGPDYKPKALPTIFQFPDDGGSLATATERCFGVGKCRKLEGGTMCPSFQVTREERHTTRGRARLLFEMLSGDTIPEGWRDESIKEALDLCLACKGCKGDCPVSVDVATYKSEFLAHYYEGRLRPVYAYSMGLIDRWARMGSLVPGLLNFMTQTPGLRSLSKRFAGVTQLRPMPAFPNQSFKQWFKTRKPSSTVRSSTLQSKGDVILWADTFNNHFTPHTAQAALAVLEDAGYRVRVPEQHLCCGRPLYDFGMLEQAKAYLRNVLTVLAPEIAAGTPIVCLEPSCASVFRAELTNLFPREEAAQRLSKQVILFPDFLDKVGYQPRPLQGQAVVHGHCHHKALWSMSPERRLLEAAGLRAEVLDSGCCGLAGSFGYEAEHHEISEQIGERVLFPRLREAGAATFIVSDGFSCRQQIAHGTDRRGMHTAEVLALGLDTTNNPIDSTVNPEIGNVQPRAAYPFVAALLSVASVLCAGLYLLKRARR